MKILVAICVLSLAGCSQNEEVKYLLKENIVCNATIRGIHDVIADEIDAGNTGVVKMYEEIEKRGVMDNYRKLNGR